jgi:hypothetical protein
MQRLFLAAHPQYCLPLSRCEEYLLPRYAIVLIAQGKKEKNRRVPDAEVSAAAMVLCKEFAGRAEAAYLSHIRCRGRSAPAEEFGGLVFFKGMMLVVLAFIWARTVISEFPILKHDEETL